MWANNGSNSFLDTAGNWIGGNLPTSSQIASFTSATFSPNNLHPQNSNLTLAGISLAVGAGPLTITGPSGSGATTLFIGASGVVNSSANALTFDISSKVNFTLTASASFTANGPIILTDSPAGAIRFDLGANTLTLDGTSSISSIAQEFSGSGSLIKSGTGTWTLTGANIYTGTTTISGGTLSVSNIVVSSGSSNLGNDTSAVVLGDATNAGRLSYTGTTATYTRGFTINAGGGEFDTTTNGQTVTIASGAVATTGVFTVGGAGNTTISSVISGTGGLAKTGPGTLTLDAANNFTGGVTLTAGFLTVNSGATLGSNATPGSLLTNGGSLILNNTTQTIASLAGPSGKINLGAGHTLIDDQAINSTFAGALEGPGNFEKSGPGNLQLSGSSSYTGTTTVNAGTLQFAKGSALYNNTPASWTTTNIIINAGATAAFNLGGTGEFTAANLDALKALGTAGGGFQSGSFLGFDTTNATGGEFAYNSSIANPNGGANVLGLVKLGPGTLTLGGTNTYSGATIVQAGTLQFGKLTALYNNTPASWTTTNIVVHAGATAAFNVGGTGEFTAANIDAIKALGTAGGGFKSGSFLGFDTTNAIGGEFAYNSNIANPNGGANVLGLVKLGPGTLTLGGTNTYSGATIVQAGTLKLGAASALSPNTTLNVANGASFDANGFSPVFSDLSGSGSLSVGTAGLAVQPSGASTFTGVLSGAGGFTMSGTGTLTLSNANTFGGTTTISSGTVELGAPGALPTGTPLVLSAGATLDLNGNTATLGKLEGSGGTIALNGASLAVDQDGTSTFSGTITGTGGLSKSGVGLLILTGDQSFTGSTNISAGELKINGSAATSPFTVSGGILSGNGTVGTLTVASGGTLAPGNSPGLLTVNGDLTMSGTTTMELSGTIRGVGGYDAIDVSGVTGSITFGGTLTVTLIDGFNPVGGQSFDLFNWTGSSSGTFGTINLPALTGGLSWDTGALYSSGVLAINGTAIPEPSAYAAILASIALFATVYRRRKHAFLRSRN